MCSNSSLPKITFVTDEELERRSEVEKARRWVMTLLSLRPVRHCPRRASRLSGTYLPDDFSYDAWRGQCLTGRRDRQMLTKMIACRSKGNLLEGGERVA